MKAGRNDPCPCGSGKKFKKCCMSKTAPVKSGVLGGSTLSTETFRQPANRAEPSVAPLVALPKSPPRPPDPERERWEAFWNEFKSKDYEGRRAFFLRTLDDPELIFDDSAFEMLSRLHQDAVAHGERARFAELVGALADRQPEVYQESAHFYLSWRLQDALADDSPDVLLLTRQLAARADRDFDTVHRSLHALAYHGQLATILEGMHIAWPLVQASDVFPWVIAEFGETGADYEIYNYLEHTPSPDPRDQGLLDRIRLFVADPDIDQLAEHIDDVAGQAAPTWTLDDFTLPPVRKNRRDEWDEEEEEDEDSRDPGAQNLARLISQFVGYLRREEGVPYPKGELIRDQLFAYFIRRHEGDLNPRLSMLEQAMNPKKKLPPPPRPSHPLCPERVTFEVHLAGLVGFMNCAVPHCDRLVRTRSRLAAIPGGARPD